MISKDSEDSMDLGSAGWHQWPQILQEALLIKWTVDSAQGGLQQLQNKGHPKPNSSASTPFLLALQGHPCVQ